MVKQIIITIANFRKQKDYITNVNTAKALNLCCKDIEFWYIGDGKERKKIERYAKNIPNIKFLGIVKNIKPLLKKADVFFLPTLYEGQCNSIIEAMRNKVPVVTTNIPENMEFLEHKKTAMLYHKKCYYAMACGIYKLLNNPILRSEIVKNAYEKSKVFNAKDMIKTYEETYKKVIYNNNRIYKSNIHNKAAN